MVYSKRKWSTRGPKRYRRGSPERDHQTAGFLVQRFLERLLDCSCWAVFHLIQEQRRDRSQRRAFLLFPDERNLNMPSLPPTLDDRHRPKRLQSGWPDPPAPEAFYGLPGRIVSAIDPHTESDRVAILIQFLIAFGNQIGRTAHFVVDGSTHFLNLFAVLVGVTSKSRKGTSWQQVKRLMTLVDPAQTSPVLRQPNWARDCIKSGLSSGEGIIQAVKDGRSNPSDESDAEPPEKRALIVEPEFDVVLQVIKRHGNTISAVLRQAWDGETLRTLTREPMEAHDAHISLIGHITRD